jgi:TolA-binding protein
MIGRLLFGISVVAPCVLGTTVAQAQDVPGIEICTVEKTMERRTSCLQSNVEFLQKTIAKLDAQHQQKLDAANRQIEALKTNLVALQKVVEELQAAQKKPADDPKKTDASKDPSTRDAPTKDGAAKNGAAKEGGK